MARSVPSVMNRVQRPHLTAEEAALETQYRPQHGCNSCQGQEWLMEVPKAGEPLEFYCTGCGRYQIVPQMQISTGGDSWPVADEVGEDAAPPRKGKNAAARAKARTTAPPTENATSRAQS